jgi:hypothetical protein
MLRTSNGVGEIQNYWTTANDGGPGPSGAHMAVYKPVAQLAVQPSPAALLDRVRSGYGASARRNGRQDRTRPLRVGNWGNNDVAFAFDG